MDVLEPASLAADRAACAAVLQASMSSSDVSSEPRPGMLPRPLPSLGGFTDTLQSTCTAYTQIGVQQADIALLRATGWAA